MEKAIYIDVIQYLEGWEVSLKESIYCITKRGQQNMSAKYCPF